MKDKSGLLAILGGAAAMSVPMSGSYTYENEYKDLIEPTVYAGKRSSRVTTLKTKKQTKARKANRQKKQSRRTNR